MAQKNPIWTHYASIDLDSILDHTAFKFPKRLDKTYEEIMSAVEKIGKHPKAGRIVPELKAFNITMYREQVVNTWRIIYRFEGATPILLGIIDGRRDMSDIIRQRVLSD